MSREPKKALIERLGEAFRVSQNRSQSFDELVAQRLGINMTDLRCLDIVQRLGRVTAGDLAQEAGLTTGAVTAVIDRLEAAGYARRVHDESDRRRVLVELTDEAEQKVWAIYGPMKQEWERMLGEFTSEELRRFIELMDRGGEVELRQAERLRALDAERRPGR